MLEARNSGPSALTDALRRAAELTGNNGSVAARIRRFCDSDLEVVVAFSVAAWQPVYASFERVLGPEVFPLVYPDWRMTQADDVRAACT